MYPIVGSLSEMYFNARCKKDNYRYHIPITDLDNFAVYFDDVMFPGLTINALLTVGIYDTSQIPFFPSAIFTNAFTFFTNWVVGTIPNTDGSGFRTFFYGRGINPLQSNIIPCQFQLRFVTTAFQQVYTYNNFALNGVTINGVTCNCYVGESVVIESVYNGAISYDCCGNYFGSIYSVIASSPNFQGFSNKTEILGKMMSVPSRISANISDCTKKTTTITQRARLIWREVPPKNADQIVCVLGGESITVNGIEYITIQGEPFKETEIDCMCNFEQDILLEKCPCTNGFGCNIPSMCIDKNGVSSPLVGLVTFADGSTRYMDGDSVFTYLSGNPIVSISPSNNDYAEQILGVPPPPPPHTNTCQKFVELANIDGGTLMPCVQTCIASYYVNGIQQIVTIPPVGSISMFYNSNDTITTPAGIYPLGSWLSIGGNVFPIPAMATQFVAGLGNCLMFLNIG